MIRPLFTAYRAAFSGLNRDIWLLSLAALVNRAGTMVLPFIALYLTRERHLSVSSAGRILALYGVGAILGAYAGGRLSDRIGTVRTQILSLLLGGAGFVWLGQVRSVEAIAAVTFVASVLSEAFRPAAMAATAQLAPEGRQPRAFALLRLAVNIGMAVGPAAGGIIAGYSYGWLFVVDGITCWLAAGMLAWSFRGRRVIVEEEVRRSAASPLRDVPFLWLLLLSTGLACGFFQIVGTLPLYFRDHYRMTEATIGLLLAFNAVLIVLFEMVLVHWAESRDHLRLAGFGCFLTCAGFALMPLGETVAFAALTVTVWTFGEMLALPMLNTVVASRAPRGAQGRYMGGFAMSFSVAFMIAPAGGTWVYDHLSPESLWAGLGVLGAVLWLGAIAVRRAFARHAAPRPEKLAAG